MPYLLRQSAQNPCILEQSVDGGVSWSQAFDYSLCLGMLGTAGDTGTAQTMIQLVQIYNTGGDSDLAPNMTQIAYQSIRQDAFCYAIEAWARSVFAAGRKRAEGEARRDRLVRGALEVASIVFAYFTGGISALVATYAAAAVAAYTIEEVTSISLEEWSDEETIQAVACCVAGKFIDPAGTNFNKEVVRAYISDCIAEFDTDSLEQRMAILLDRSFETDEAWIAFTQICADAFILTQAGGIQCACACPFLPNTRLDWNGVGATPAGWTSTAEPASYNPGVGHFISTRGASQDWTPTGGSPEVWAVTSVQYQPDFAGQVSKLGIRVGYASGNTHGVQVAVRQGTTWTVVGDYGDATPAPLFEQRNFTFPAICADEVRFTAYGYLPKIEICSINQDA